MFPDYCMTKLTCGEILDDNGNPIPGTGFTYESDGRVAELLAQRITPVLYSPPQGEWAWMIPDESNGKNERGVAVSPAGNKGPLVHYHPSFDEHFKAAAGTWVLKADSEEVTLNAGEDLYVKSGVVHTFRCVGEEGDFGVMEFDVLPAVGFGDMLKAAFGQAHDYNLNPRKDQPPLIQTFVSLRGFQTKKGLGYMDLAVMVPPGKTIQTIFNILSIFIAPIGRLLGYKPDYPNHHEDEFWEKRVNQPSK